MAIAANISGTAPIKAVTAIEGGATATTTNAITRYTAEFAKTCNNATSS